MHRIVCRCVAGGVLSLGLAQATFGEPPAPPPASPPLAPVAPAEAGWLGVWLADAVDGGVQIVAVWPGGPADRGGIRSGDVLLEAAGAAVLDQADLGRVVAARGAGEEVPIVVLRGSQKHLLAIRLGTRRSMPTAPPGASLPRRAPNAPVAAGQSPADAAGIEVEAITPALRRYLGAPEAAGVLVTRVVPGRLAALGGLRVGDVIVRLGDEDVSSAGQVRGTLAPWRSEPLLALIVRERRAIELQLGSARPAPGREPGTAPSRDEQLRRIQSEIERLELRIEELRRAAEELSQAD